MSVDPRPWEAGLASHLQQNEEQIAVRSSLPPPASLSWDFSFLHHRQLALAVASGSTALLPGLFCVLPWKWAPGTPEKHIPVRFTPTPDRLHRAQNTRAHVHTHNDLSTNASSCPVTPHEDEPVTRQALETHMGCCGSHAGRGSDLDSQVHSSWQESPWAPAAPSQRAEQEAGFGFLVKSNLCSRSRGQGMIKSCSR